MQNILTNNVKSLKLRLLQDKYFDFMLYKGGANYPYLDEECFAVTISPEDYNTTSRTIISKSEWADAVNEDVVLENPGFTGVDNGLFTYDKNRISNKEFLDAYINCTMDLSVYGKKLFLHGVSGNTGLYEYPMELKEDYLEMKGGFLQGFFKVEGYDYQTLPSKMDNEWNLGFVLRPMDYEVSPKTMNTRHPQSNGIFFYMGTRAENKFWHYYKVDTGVTGEFASRYSEELYVSDDNDCPCNIEGIETPNCDFIEDVDKPWEDEYWEKTVKIESNDFETKTGIESDNKDHYEIETDNKFIFFNRTKTGFTVSDWEEGVKVLLEGKKRPNINWFPLMNRTATGWTVQTAEKYIEEEYEGDKYDILKDTYNNCFALRITPEGAIGYRYGIYNCEAESFDIVEEYSKNGLIKKEEWNSIVVKFKTDTVDKCEKRKGRKMKIYIYIGTNLVFVSKELPVLSFKALDDAYQKQETVPYNISIGGGTQGLMEEIFPDYFATTEYELPLERNFGGTFIGDLKSFKFYTCPLDYASTIKIND